MTITQPQRSGAVVPGLDPAAVAELREAEAVRDEMYELRRPVAEAQDRMLHSEFSQSFADIEESCRQLFAMATDKEEAARRVIRDHAQRLFKGLGIDLHDAVEVDQLTVDFGDASHFDTVRLRIENFELSHQLAPHFVLSGSRVDGSGTEHRQQYAEARLLPGSIVRVIGKTQRPG